MARCAEMPKGPAAQIEMSRSAPRSLGFRLLQRRSAVGSEFTARLLVRRSLPEFNSRKATPNWGFSAAGEPEDDRPFQRPESQDLTENQNPFLRCIAAAPNVSDGMVSVLP